MTIVISLSDFNVNANLRRGSHLRELPEFPRKLSDRISSLFTCSSGLTSSLGSSPDSHFRVPVAWSTGSFLESNGEDIHLQANPAPARRCAIGRCRKPPGGRSAGDRRFRPALAKRARPHH